MSDNLLPSQSSLNSHLGKILVVENEELIRELITLNLEAEGYFVTVAKDGRVAWDLLQKSKSGSLHAFDLIILDLMLPHINGLDICRLLRHEQNQVPVLIVSAKNSELDRVAGLEVGADDYLVKPFGIKELIARCRALMRRCHRDMQVDSSQRSAIKVKNLSLYPHECRVMLHGQEVDLAPKEYRLLELFMMNPRRVWSRDELIEQIWGLDFMGDTKTVDVHIRWLREKLEVAPSRPEYIVTVRGFGYRLG